MALAPITEEVILVQCLEGGPAPKEPSVPLGAVRATFQNATGVVFSRLFTDPTEVSEMLAIWHPYKAAVDATLDPLLPDGLTPNPSYGQPWPPAPAFLFTLAPK